ncbi:MAG: hypothetical protein S4CHLAM45_14780 [Chlamydiales bacterium]|nr:hypothetical protein [Chlamydiales bacterium]MCH9620561.1 hypothetical protein [Chlamydiales bacterium]MCH9623567.1 hypothetical protein [Chlamydiales bacterium]
MDPINPLTRYSPPPHLPWTELQDKNKATHIPPEEFQELVTFLQTHSPEMATAIEQGSLLKKTELDLSHKGLTELPSSLRHLTNLTELNVSVNQLTVLPDAIGQLTNLTHLSVSGNQLTILPDTIGQLANLTQLDVSINRLTALPPSIGYISCLETLRVDGNPNLSTLPIFLGNCSRLMHLNIEGTSIPKPSRGQILAACRGMRGLEAFEKFPYKIKLWRGLADVIEEWPDPKFTKKQKEIVYEWLFHLEKASDFKRDQKELEETTCAILETVYTDAKFREIFFNLIAVDLTVDLNSVTQPAISLNLVYTGWKLYALPAEASLSEKVQLLVGCARAQKLRQAVLSRYPGYKNVEKVLYAEVNLRERLGLVTAITSMMHEDIEHVEGSVLEDIAQEIEAIPVAELVVGSDYWENYLKEHHAPEFSRIVSRTQAALWGLMKRADLGNVTNEEHGKQQKVLLAQKKEAILQLTQQIIDKI